MPGFIGLPELIVLGLVVLLVFGPKRVPEMGRSLGRGLRESKSSVTGGDEARSDVQLEGAPLAAAAVETVRAPEREAA